MNSIMDIGLIHRQEYELTDDRSEPVVIAEAPGRIHFLGEHGDPSSGVFLSAAIDRHINVAVSPRNDNSFRFFAADLSERKRCTLPGLKYKREDRWANYIKSAIYLFVELGYPMKGLNFTYNGNIPQQIGLASSTAIEIAAATALRGLLRVQISDMELAKKLHKTHVDYFGNTASLADYQIGLMARKDQLFVIDTFADEITKIKSPFTGFKFLLVDSRVPRFGVENELVARKADTVKGLEYIQKKLDTSNFKDLGSADLLDALGNFPEKIRRRIIHIVEEIHRVGDAFNALQRKDIAAFAKIIYHSHESLRDFYEISCPEVDWLVKRAHEIEGAAGSRLTGQGFGSCTYTIIRRELVEEYKKRLEEYEKIFGFRAIIYEVKLATGARLIPTKKEEL
jgi:galactokinase